MVNNLIRMLARCNCLILRLSLLSQLSFKKLSIIAYLGELVLICIEMILVYRDYLEKIFFMAASFTSLISDSESLSSR